MKRTVVVVFSLLVSVTLGTLAMADSRPVSLVDTGADAHIEPLSAFIHADAGVLQHVRDRVQNDVGNATLRRDWFAKMGGSSVASKAFLHCFATDHVLLGEHADLEGTLAFFRGGVQKNAFNRQSVASGTNWNLKYALGGKPPYWQREIDEVRPQWALVLFGSNDAQNRNERIYARRLLQLVDGLLDAGVVPVLGSATPRRNAVKNRWANRFSKITRAIADHRRLPFVDYYGALQQLPHQGLARDGTHPNVAGKGGLKRVCNLDASGLRFGHHVRNALTLMMLDRLLQATSGDAPSQNAEQPSTFPFSEIISKRMLANKHDRYEGCRTSPQRGPEYRATLTLQGPRKLRFASVDLTGRNTKLFLVRKDAAESECVTARPQSITRQLEPGTWELIVELSPKAADRGELLVLIDRE